jgi:hypothetical protein
MSNAIAFKEDELEELERVLEHELRRAAVEVHRTDSLPFKRELQRQCEVDESLLAKVRSVKTSPVGT